MTVCPSCSKELPGAFPFCPFCGVSLTVAVPHPVHEERKVVTVLFADLVGFTRRAEQMDPEDVRALLSPYYARLRTELERFGGTVEKFIGDAVMALFGAPVAHEDDPERAVRAALSIPVWEALQARARAQTETAQTPLVGRGDELELLRGLLHRARRERAPQVVTLVGVPGIGKSRLLAELLAALKRDGERVTWRVGRS